MPISEDSRAALALLREVQESVRNTEDLKNNAQVIKHLLLKITVIERSLMKALN